MKYINFESNYDKEPETKVEGYSSFSTWPEILKEIKKNIKEHYILTVESYPGVEDDAIFEEFKKNLNLDLVIDTRDLFYDKDELNKRMEIFLTEDRVRGRMCYGKLEDFIDKEKLKNAKEKINREKGVTLIYGFGASLVDIGNLLVYIEITRWECQLRYRRGCPNYKAENYDEDPLKKNKRGYFVEWRLADRRKTEIFEKIDYYIDANNTEHPVMVTGKALRESLKEVIRRPFRLVPYFDPGVWGGQWMKEVCLLDKDKINYAWSFDGVPEENSLYLRFNENRLETPALNLVKYLPKELLGKKTFSRFGSEFPIRFDFLDTMDGGNLSLQVHPTTEYIKEHFGMPYTQDESYYILDAKEDGGVFLGIKEDAEKSELIEALKEAQKTNKFDEKKYINFFKAKKHDHFLIPSGTIHCSSKNCMVLEVSATPYIFTFKLWDWDRVDLNGKPRPIHIEDGKNVIDGKRKTKWIKENLVNRFTTLFESDDYKEIKTGLHELEFIETHVFEIKNEVKIKTNNEVSMLNLVEGESAIIESVDNSFTPYTVHYAETFIIPAAINSVIIKPEKKGNVIKVLRANVRF